MPVNLANVNVSLQQFQAISTGKYNAGEVKLSSETTLGKINNHVHSTGKNKTELSHAEVLAIKQAFVKALTQGGVGADEIARVRRELGLGTDDFLPIVMNVRALVIGATPGLKAALERLSADPFALRAPAVFMQGEHLAHPLRSTVANTLFGTFFIASFRTFVA